MSYSNVQKGNMLVILEIIINFVCLFETDDKMVKKKKHLIFFYVKQSLLYQLVFEVNLNLAKSAYIFKYD